MSKKYKFLIVASYFYPKITDGLLRGAISELDNNKHTYDVYKVSGSLEIPVQISILLKKKNMTQSLQLAVLSKEKLITTNLSLMQ